MRAAGERRVAGRERKDDRCHREVGKPSNARPSVSPRHGLELLGRRPSQTRLRIRSPLHPLPSVDAPAAKPSGCPKPKADLRFVLLYRRTPDDIPRRATSLARLIIGK